MYHFTISQELRPLCAAEPKYYARYQAYHGLFKSKFVVVPIHHM